MNSTHTPGPYKMIAANRKLLGGRGPAFDLFGDTNRNPEHWEIVASGLSEADANFLSAAPELLAACRAFLAAGSGEISNYSDDLDEANDLAYAAVKKAQGGARC